MLYRCTAPTVSSPCSYEPSLLLIAQGRKRVDLGRANYVFGQSRFLLTSIELPVVSQVITASEDAPYLAFFLKLDISTVRDILNTEEVHVPETPSGARGMAIGETTVELVNACSRLMDLLDAPQDIPFFGKLIQREIIYRLLQGTQGQRLRGNGHAGRPKPSDGEGGCMVTCELPETSACGTTGNGRRHEPIYAASPFSCSYCDESPSVSEAASPACGATAHAHE
jgi:hypothetical protein